MLVAGPYVDFGPTLATDGLWIDYRHRLPPLRQPRNCRERVGELIRFDQSI